MPADLLLLWNDVEFHRRREYECWHAVEHVAERTWVPGFRRGSRYERVEGAGARYLTAYELDDLGCLDSAEYRSLVERPTPWSASMRPSLRDFLRRTYVGRAEVGSTSGGFAWVRRLVLEPNAADTPLDVDALVRSMLRLASQAAPHGATRVQVGLQRDSGPQAIANVDTAPAGMELVVVVHLTATAGVGAIASMLDSMASTALPMALWQADAVYRMLSTVSHEDVRSASRPPPRDDLRLLDW